MLIAFSIAGLILASGISAPIWQSMTGLKLTEMEKNMNNPAYADVMKILQVITAVVGFFIPAVVTAAMLNRRPFKLLGLAEGASPQQAGVVILIIGASLAVATGLSYINAHVPIPESWHVKFMKLEDNYNRQVEAIIRLKDTKDYIIALVVMAFLPAVCEETLFRGGLQNFLTRATNMPWLSIIKRSRPGDDPSGMMAACSSSSFICRLPRFWRIRNINPCWSTFPPCPRTAPRTV